MKLISKEFLNIILLTLAFTLLWQSFVKPKTEKPVIQEQTVIIEASRDSYVVSKDSKPILITIHNYTKDDIEILPCSEEIVFEVTTKNAAAKHDCNFDVSKNFILTAGESKSFDLLQFNYLLFPEKGYYDLKLKWRNVDSPDYIVSTSTIQFEDPSFFTQAWRFLIYAPIYNALALIAFYLPGKNVGMAIILLTIIIRTLLLIPTNKAMKSQRALQEIQPKLQEIQAKYKDNQQMIAQETMKLWKTHKVNPLGSCLPILIQAPIMIGVFYAVKSGFDVNHSHLIYNSYSYVDLSMLNTNFFGLLELTEKNLFVLPFIVGVFQFIQIKLSMASKQSKKEPKKKKSKKEIKKTEPVMQESMKMMQSSMLYVLPVMIAVFSAGLPSGIGLYWASSTLYGVIQQIVINKETCKKK